MLLPLLPGGIKKGTAVAVPVKIIGLMRLDVEQEVHDVAVLHHVFLAFHAQHAVGAAGGFAFVAHVVGVGDDFGADEAAFEVGVDDTGSLGAFQPLWMVQARTSSGPAVK